MDALRPFNIPPGDYMLPKCDSSKDMKSPEFMEKLKKGPVIVMTVIPNGPFSMGKSLVQWFIYCIVVGVFCADIAGAALTSGAEAKAIFHFAGLTAFIGYALALLHDSIWWARSWSTTFKFVFDGIIYGLITGATFSWLWPALQ